MNDLTPQEITAVQHFAGMPKKNISEQGLKTTNASTLMQTEFAELIQPVQGLIIEGLTLLVGASKIGKSWLVLDLCLSVASGMPFLNRATEKSEVLYLALEDSQRRLQNRLNKLRADKESLGNLSFCTEASTLEDNAEKQLMQWIAEHPAASLIVIDTLQKIRGISARNQNAYQADYEMINRIKRIADKNHIAIVLVHHTNKLRIVSDSFDKVSGSTGLMGAADTTILIDRERDEKQATVQVAGRDVNCDDFVITFNDGKWSMLSSDAQAYSEEQMYCANPVVQLLRLIVSENPNGGRFSYERVINDAHRILEQSPFIDSRDFTKKLKSIQHELFKRDGFEIETGITISITDEGVKRSCKGMRITIHEPKTYFQTRLDTD